MLLPPRCQRARRTDPHAAGVARVDGGVGCSVNEPVITSAKEVMAGLMDYGGEADPGLGALLS